MLGKIRWKVSRSGNDAIITSVADGVESVKRETGAKADALLRAMETAQKLDVWCVLGKDS